jgi:hypothetical protein
MCIAVGTSGLLGKACEGRCDSLAAAFGKERHYFVPNPITRKS